MAHRHIICIIFIHVVWRASGDVYNHYTSTYGEICYDACRKDGENYYWCNTRKGWDYCSMTDGTDYKGVPCRDDHPCRKYGKDYYWCRNKINEQGYCGAVEPKTLRYMSSTYQKLCNDDCFYDEQEQYYWCNTEQGWDYCSPLPDMTHREESCRPNNHCGAHGKDYTWCYTSRWHWNYCSLIHPNECRYRIAQRKKRQDGNNAQPFCQRIDGGNRITTYFYAEPNTRVVADGSSMAHEITNIIARWHNGLLGAQAKSRVLWAENLRIDLQGIVNRPNGPYYNLQVQVNTNRLPGGSTTVSQVLLPVGPSIPERYVRMAFVESFRRRARVFVEVQAQCFSQF